MAREILFRAKRIDNGEWIEGHYYSQGYHKDTIEEEWYHFIKPLGSESWESVRVNPFTLCQYTGLVDNNGNKIWENDIVRYTDDIINKVKEDLIKWNETHAAFVRLHKSEMGLQNLFINERIANECEVIGNIFDNPELVE